VEAKGVIMKDLLGREVQVGHYICYALTAGRSANLAVYRVLEVFEDKIKAVKIDSSYGMDYGNHLYTLNSEEKVQWKYTKWCNKTQTRVAMTEAEKFKVDNKTSTLSMPERIFILDGFKPELFEDK
jgi:hypothetical protein